MASSTSIHSAVWPTPLIFDDSTGTALIASVAQKTGTSSPSFGVKVAAMDVDEIVRTNLSSLTPRRFTTELLTMPTLAAAAAGSFCGEVYVYQVAGNSGALGAPPVAGSVAGALNVIRGHSGGSAFGGSLGVVSEGGNSTLSWLVAQTSMAVVVSGIAGSGITPALYPSPGAGALVVETLQRSVTMRVDAAWNYSAAMVPPEASMASRHICTQA